MSGFSLSGQIDDLHGCKANQGANSEVIEGKLQFGFPNPRSRLSAPPTCWLERSIILKVTSPWTALILER